MANNITVVKGDISTEDLTTVAATVDTITIQEDWDRIRIETNGADELIVTTDGTTPAAASHTSQIVPKQVGAAVVRELNIRTQGNTTIKLLSATAVVYRIERMA